MLRYPFLNEPYAPTLRYLVGCFDVYDREETLGEELSQYDPNDSKDRDILIRRYCLSPKQRENFRHRRAKFDLLEQSLANPAFDFSAVWADDEDDDCYWSWPYEWDEISDPRVFFRQCW